MPDLPPSHDDLPILRELRDDLKDAFRTASAGESRTAPRPPASARRRLRVSLGAAVTAFSVMVAVGVAVLAVALLGHRRQAADSSAARQPAATSCQAEVRHDALPIWARSGFSNPRERIAHVLGGSRNITGILFANPLLAPPPRDHTNKILWVSRVAANPGSDLRISAQQMIGSKRIGSPVARRVTGGPGPSTINLPSPGCWRLTLRWSGHVDSLDLHYAANRK